MADGSYTPSAPAIHTGGTAQVGDLLRQFESLKSGRIDFDRKWQMVSDYILPRRDFSVTQRPNQLRPHRVTSSVATNAIHRMAAFLLSYLVGLDRPFLLPNVKRGLAMAGRPTDLDDAGLDYLNSMEWTVWSHMMLPRAQLMLRLFSMLIEFCGFGCGVIWTGRKRGFGPYFNTRPLQACWWSENEEGVIDTLYFKMMLPVYRVIQRWPAAAPLWQDQAGKPNDEMAFTSVILACRPRPGGRPGAVAEAKPFEWTAFSEEKKTILEETGYDSFPYAVFRYNPMPGMAYAEGAGCHVLPDVMVLNHLQQAIENCASQKAEPAIAVPARMFGKALDRRPGAINAYNPAGLGLQRADQAILKLDLTGDATDAENMIKILTGNIELGTFTDWLRLRESGDMTAEEVGERRDMRLRGASSIVASCEQPMCALGDRTLEVLGAENILEPGPPSIARAEVDWEYSGPLATAQLRGNVQSALQMINARALVAKDDPAAADAVDLEEQLRVINDGLAGAPKGMKTRAEVQANREAMQKAQQAEADAANAAKMGQAAQGAGAGVASVAGAAADAQEAAPGPGGGLPAPFAPAAPFAQPIAA